MSIHPLATLTPPSNARTWLSSPHPSLPLLATACADHSAKIYSLRTFALLSAATGGHKRSVRTVAWKPSFAASSAAADEAEGDDESDGGTNETLAARGAPDLVLATGSFDATAAIWKSSGGGGGGGLSHRRHEVDFNSSSTSGPGNPADEEDDEEEEDWRYEISLDGHDSEIKSLSFCPVAPLLATCSRDKSVWIWEELEPEDFGGGGGEGNYETVAVLAEHDGDVKCVAWHPNEPLLASGSYDDEIRLWREDVDDWACCARLTEHGGTVWWVEFEGTEIPGRLRGEEGEGEREERRVWREERKKAGPRLISCSDDLSIRIWKRTPKVRAEAPTGQGRIPSIWRNNDFEEEWTLETRLPQLHDRPVYAVSWSRKTGRVVSAGSDGLIVVYEERWRAAAEGDVEMKDGTPGADAEATKASATEWVVVAQIENAHDVFEINHVVWAPRADKRKRWKGEEVIVSTGDDGEVKVWYLDG